MSQPPVSEPITTKEPEMRRGDLEEAFIQTMRFVVRKQPDSPLSDLPIAQVRCLNAIGREPGLKMQELATRMETTLPATSQIVDRLVRREMVERHADETDRRVVRLQLTASAQKIVAVEEESKRAKWAAAVTLLKDEGRYDTVLSALRLLSETMRRGNKEESEAAFVRGLESFTRQSTPDAEHFDAGHSDAAHNLQNVPDPVSETRESDRSVQEDRLS